MLTRKGFTEIKKIIYPGLSFQDFREEKEETGPIAWHVENKAKDFSIIYGFANDVAKTIIINSEGDIQPKKFFVRDNLWVWYVTFDKNKVKLPLRVTVYDTNDHIIFGGNKGK